MTKANYTLFSLYEFLSVEGTQLRELRVGTISHLDVDDQLLADSLSPLIAIGARVPYAKFTFQRVSLQVASNIRASTIILRMLLSRYEETTTYIDLNVRCSVDDSSTSKVAHIDDLLVPAQRFNYLYTMPHESELSTALDLLEKHLARMADEDLDGSVKEVIGKCESLDVAGPSRSIVLE